MCGRKALAIIVGILAIAGCTNYVFAADTHSNAVTTITAADYRYNDQAPVGYFEVKGVDGKSHIAFCGWHEKKMPEKGWELNTIDVYTAENKKNENLRKVLWYGFEGPGDIGAKYAETSLAASVALGHMDVDDTGESAVALGKPFLNKVKSKAAPPSNFTVYCVRNMKETNYEYQCLVYYVYEPYGEIVLQKGSTREDLTNVNSNYSLENAVYGIYSDENCTNKVAELTTDQSGKSEKIELEIGTYYLKEITPPKGYQLDKEVYKVTVLENQLTEVKRKDEPHKLNFSLLISKYDADKTFSYSNNLSRGEATLEGAEYQVEFYGGEYKTLSSVENVEPLKRWTFRTDAKGNIYLKNEYKVSGDELWSEGQGVNYLPLGTLVVRETVPSQGYTLNDTVFIKNIQANEEGIVSTSSSVMKAPEKIIKGNIKIIKFYKDQITGETHLMEGIDFVLTSKTDGKTYRITTDKNGVASTEKIGGLVYDTYCVTEENTPEGFVACEPFEISIREDEKTIELPIENKQVEIPKEKMISTTALDKKTQSHEGVLEEQTTVVDKIEYQNFTVGKFYTIKGKLMNRKTGTPLLVDGKEVTSQKSFFARTENGKIEMEFTFNGLHLDDISIVVFEEIYENGSKILEHSELNNDNQTVNYKKVAMTNEIVKTGDGNKGIIYASLACAALGLAIGMMKKKRTL